MHVYSTHSTNIAYVEYDIPGDKNVLPRVKKTVTIKGGAGVANKHLLTPGGIHTEVSDDDMAFLLGNPEFVQHMQAGFVSYETHKIDPDHVGADMAHGDGSAPLTDDFYRARGAAVKANGRIDLSGKDRASV